MFIHAIDHRPLVKVWIVSLDRVQRCDSIVAATNVQLVSKGNSTKCAAIKNDLKTSLGATAKPRVKAIEEHGFSAYKEHGLQQMKDMGYNR